MSLPLQGAPSEEEWRYFREGTSFFSFQFCPTAVEIQDFETYMLSTGSYKFSLKDTLKSLVVLMEWLIENKLSVGRTMADLQIF